MKLFARSLLHEVRRVFHQDPPNRKSPVLLHQEATRVACRRRLRRTLRLVPKLRLRSTQERVGLQMKVSEFGESDDSTVATPDVHRWRGRVRPARPLPFGPLWPETGLRVPRMAPKRLLAPRALHQPAPRALARGPVPFR